jgi:hypothetical protein
MTKVYSHHLRKQAAAKLSESESNRIIKRQEYTQDQKTNMSSLDHG